MRRPDYHGHHGRPVQPMRPVNSVRPTRPVAKKRGGVLGKIALVLGPLLLTADAMDVLSLLQGGADELMARGVYDQQAIATLDRYASWGGAVDSQPAELNNFYALPMGIEKTASSVVASRAYLPQHDLNLQMAFAYEIPSVGAQWSEVVDHSQLFVELSKTDENDGEFLGCFYVNQGKYKTDMTFEELLAQEIQIMKHLGSDGAVLQCKHASGGRLVAAR